MAATQRVRVQGTLRPDNRCHYRSFSQRVDGKVPCLAIGQDLASNRGNFGGEITGITFQKVNGGEVRAVIPSDEFSHVDWPNAPTRYGRPGPNLDIGAPPQDPPAVWQEFASTVRHTRSQMLTRMTPPGPPPVPGSVAVPPPDSILEGIRKDVWVNDNVVTSYIEIPADTKLESIINAAGENWSNTRCIQGWAYDIVDGLNGATHFQDLFNTLFPNSNVRGQKVLVSAPRGASNNMTVRQGVVHCLAYGFYEAQRMEARKPRARKRHEYVSNRILLRKETDNRTRSRSRSPISDDDDQDDDDNRHEDGITRHVRDVTNPPDRQPAMVSIDEMVHDPAKYLLYSDRYFHYFEPHKPRFLYCSRSTVESDDAAGGTKSEYTVKLLVEICSAQKYGTGLFSERHLKETTEGCVKNCLAGISVNQDNIYGLAVVPDGLKLIRVERRQNPTTYFVSETELVTWDQTETLYALLEMVNNALQ